MNEYKVTSYELETAITFQRPIFLDKYANSNHALPLWLWTQQKDLTAQR